MPRRDDLEVVLRCVADLERELESRSDADEQAAALGHANGLLKLGDARAREGKWQEADRLLDESATAFWATGLALGRECSAMARVRQATVAMSQDHNSDALGIFDRLIEQFDGFPRFETVPAMLAAGLGGLGETFYETRPDLGAGDA